MTSRAYGELEHRPHRGLHPQAQATKMSGLWQGDLRLAEGKSPGRLKTASEGWTVQHGPLHRKFGRSRALNEPVRSADRWNRFCEPSLLEVEPPEKFITPLSTPDLMLERRVLRRGIARPASEDGARR